MRRLHTVICLVLALLVSAYIPAEASKKPIAAAESQLASECFTVEQTVPSTVSFAGTLVLQKENGTSDGYYSKPRFLDLDTGIIHRISVYPISTSLDPIERGYATTPNGQWLAYISYTLDEIGLHHSKRELQVMNASGRHIDLTYWNRVQTWQWIVGWLDDAHLALSIPGRSAGAVTVLNPFTGQWKELKVNRPDLSEWSFLYPNIDSAVVFYEPSLTRFAYPVRPYGYSLAIWDLNKAQRIWAGDLASFNFEVPLWSPDGSRLAIVVDTTESINDIVSVDAQGRAERLTNLSDEPESRNYAYISDLSWSSNGGYLAFWKSPSQPVYDYEHRLAIMQVATKQVYDPCISTGWFPDRAIWSPNADYLAVSTVTVDEYFGRWQTLILDLQTKHAYKIADDAIPLAWMMPK